MAAFGAAVSVVVPLAVLPLVVGAALTKGSTAFKPPEIEARVALAFNDNYARVPERQVLFVQQVSPDMPHAAQLPDALHIRFGPQVFPEQCWSQRAIHSPPR